MVKTLANSLLPTPVGPKKRNDAQGRSSSDIPVLARFMALDTPSTASSWPITSLLSSLSSLSKASFSLLPNVLRGIPVQSDTTSLTSSTFTLLSTFLLLLSHSFSNFSISSFSSFSSLSNCSACSILPFLICFLLEFCTVLKRLIKLDSSWYPSSIFIRLVAHASSSRSIALSGKYLLLTYLSDNLAAASRASLLILIL